MAVEYELVGRDRYRATMPNGRSTIVTRTNERSYCGLPHPNGGERYEYHGEFYRWAINRMHEDGRTGGYVLDVGCGGGYGTRMLQQAGYQAFGLDVSDEAIGFCKAKYPTLMFTQADASDLPFDDDTFTAVVSSENIEHIAQDQRAMDEVARVLMPGGMLVMTTPNAAKRDGVGEHHEREYNPAEFRHLVEGAGFSVVEHRIGFGEFPNHQGVVAFI